MPALRLFVSGAESAQTFSTLFVVSVFYQRSGRLWDLSLHTLHNLPTVKYWQGLRVNVRMCAYVGNDLVIVVQRWVLDHYLRVYYVPNEKDVSFFFLNTPTKHKRKNSSGCILILDTTRARPFGVLNYSF